MMAFRIGVQPNHATHSHVAKRKAATETDNQGAVQNFFPSVDQTDRHAMPLSIDAHATLALPPTVV